MALAQTTIFEIKQGSSASNVNGGGFNPANANFLADLACDADTGNTASPVVSSASYTFVAGDVDAWIYKPPQANWTQGFYKIVSVAGGKATLSAAVGAAVQWDSTLGRWIPSTVIGIGTIATPTGGTFGVDYSQQTSAILTAADYASVGSSTTLTSATGGFTPAMVGNLYHQTTTGTGGFGVVGWYEIASYTNATTVVLDRTPNSGTASVACTGYTGGAMSLASNTAGQTDDDFFEMVGGPVGGCKVFIKGSLSLSTAVTMAAGGGVQNPIWFIGYNSVRGDKPTGANRPTIAGGSLNFSMGANINVLNLIVASTSATCLGIGSTNKVINCKAINNSTAAARLAMSFGGQSCILNNEAISYRGTAIQSGSASGIIMGNYCHDSNIGIRSSGTASVCAVVFNVVESCVTAAIQQGAANISANLYAHNTLYGSEQKTGTGIDFVTGVTVGKIVFGNIIYGFVTGIAHADVQSMFYLDYNDFFNNTTDVSNVQKGANDKAVNPSFTSVGQITGTAGAFVAGGGKLVDTSKNFTALGVTAGRDCVYIISGTGATASQYLIDSISTTTNPNDTLNITLPASPGTDTTADKVYQLTIGRNFGIGTNLKALGFPGAFQGGYSTGYLDIGAVQRQESAGGGGEHSYTF